MMTKQELDNWHADAENFLSMPINLSGDNISDVIIYDKMDARFLDINGRQFSDIKSLIRKDNRFIIVPIEKLPIKGLYVKADEEHDILMMIQCELRMDYKTEKCKWVIESRSFVSRNYECWNSLNSMGDYIDVCGQTPYAEGMNMSYFRVNYSGAKKEVIKYFAGIPYIKSIYGRDYLFHDMSDFDNYVSLMNRCLKYDAVGEIEDKDIGGITVLGLNDNFVTHGGACGWKSNITRTPLGPLPKEAEESLVYIARKFYNDNSFKQTLEAHYPEDLNLVFCIVQKINGQAVQRSFIPVFYYASDLNNPETELVEVSNTYLNEKNLDFDQYGKTASTAICVWCDDLSGTKLEHASFIIEENIKSFFKAAKTNDDWFIWGLRSASVDCIEKYGIGQQLIVRCALMIALSPVLEMVFKLNVDEKIQKNYFKMRAILTRDAVNINPTQALLSEFGSTDNTKTKFHEIIKAPKGFFEYCLEKNSGSTFHLSKALFCSSEEKMDYFMRMNKEDYSLLADKVTTFIHDGELERMFDVLYSMIDMYGVKSWRAYIKHIETIIEKGQAKMYLEYIEMLDTLLREVGYSADWKLSDEALEKAYASASIVQAVISQEDYDVLVEKMQERQKELKKYCFENKDYKIIVPSSPEDIIREGVLLKHCAKEYVEKVAYGKTDMLFIRDVNKEKKPFYTLEVRHDKIRQCHGACNKNVESKKLENFLYEFCDYKQIEFSIGDKTLGVGAD